MEELNEGLQRKRFPVNFTKFRNSCSIEHVRTAVSDVLQLKLNRNKKLDLVQSLFKVGNKSTRLTTVETLVVSFLGGKSLCNVINKVTYLIS